MAICDDCEQEMLSGASCIYAYVSFGGHRYERVRYKEDGRRPPTCGDCGVRQGGIHHFGCDLELCPKCEGQLITCVCSPDKLWRYALVSGDEFAPSPKLRGADLN